MQKKELEAFSHMPFVFVVKDSEGRYVWANDYFLEIAGASRLEEVLGKTDFDMVWKDDALSYASADRKVWETGKPHKVRETVNRADGSCVTANSCKFLDDLEGRQCLFVVGISL